ncbi:MAG: helix-turn-helix transcriptional regulator [Lachnospiraceae bacterium]|nr:helix-turn-helix transcriptional regulator [Lachnospiraceae bacterium]
MDNWGLFGRKLRSIRKELCQTQERFCDGICSLRQYKRIESGTNEPTLFVLDSLSSKYNLDFFTIYKKTERSNSDNDFSFINEMNDAIDLQDVKRIEELISKYSDSFDSMGLYSKMLWYYGKSLCEEDTDISIDYAITGLRYELPDNPGNHESFLQVKVYSNIGLCLLNRIAFNYIKKENYSLAILIYKHIIQCIESLLSFSSKLYQSTKFIFEFYPSVISNLCVLLLSDGNLEEALVYVNKGIEYLCKMNNSKQLHILLWRKYKILAAMGDIEAADEVYNSFRVICELFNQKEYLAGRPK